VDVTNPFLRHVPSSVRVYADEPGPGRPATVERIVSASHEEAFREQLRHFHRCVTDPATFPLTSAAESLADIRLMSEIVRSALPDRSPDGRSGAPPPAVDRSTAPAARPAAR